MNAQSTPLHIVQLQYKLSAMWASHSGCIKLGVDKQDHTSPPAYTLSSEL